MNFHLHVSQKIFKDDGTVLIQFTPILINPIVGSYLDLSYIRFVIPIANDTFVIGKDYDSNFTLLN